MLIVANYLHVISKLPRWTVRFRAMSSQAKTHKVAIRDNIGDHTYSDLALGSHQVSSQLNTQLAPDSGHNVAFLSSNNSNWVRFASGIWNAGHVAVPLCPDHPARSLEYYINDSEARKVLVTEQFAAKIAPIVPEDKLVVFSEASLVKKSSEENDCPNNIRIGTEKRAEQEAAMIIYTSGTTGPPKGVVHTFRSIQSQIKDMVEAWEWTEQDGLLHVLPLHHVHGIVNCLLCPLSQGASVHMLAKFSAQEAWKVLLDTEESINLFMAVPTVYVKLMDYYKKAFQSPEEQAKVKSTLSSKFRLMPVLEAWHSLSGHSLLNRYGMTELGMALTNPLEPQERLQDPSGMRPFPGVQVRIVNPDLIGDEKLVSGALQVRGSNVFKEYYNKPEATEKEFRADGWFDTGDMAELDNRTGKIRLLGRASVDIIKSGGYKISALDVERVLLEHPDIAEVAVLGLEDPTWGQTVGAVIVQEPGSQSMDIDKVRNWCASRMPKYQMPTRISLLDALPRNNMGKVNKKELVKIAF